MLSKYFRHVGMNECQGLTTKMGRSCATKMGWPPGGKKAQANLLLVPFLPRTLGEDRVSLRVPRQQISKDPVMKFLGVFPFLWFSPPLLSRGREVTLAGKV